MTVPEPMEELPSSEVDVGRLLKKCEDLVCQFQYDLALKFCEKILWAAPGNIEVRMMKATIYIDSGDEDAAREILLEAISLEPDTGAEKYMALAQLCEGQQALELFQKAIEITSGFEGPCESNARVLSSLYCSMAELYMTDLCMETNAEERCEELLERARSVCPEGYEVLQTLANMKMSQDQLEKAREFLFQSISMWKAIPFDDDDYPSLEFRLVSSRLLVEMQQWEAANEILEALTQEDDEILEVWYLLAFTLYALDQTEDSKRALECAIDLARREPDQSTEIIEAISELQSVLGMETESCEIQDDNGEDGNDIAYKSAPEDMDI